MKNSPIILTALIVSLFTVSLPVSGNTRVQPDTIPATWEYETPFLQTTPNDDNWWNNFNDPILTRLIARAVENNYDVLAAQQRIEAARQAQSLVLTGYYPTVNVEAGWNLDNTSGTIHKEHSHAAQMRYFGLGLSMNWEIDVFGRIRARSKMARANFEASVADYDATQVTLCANLAKAYIQLRMAQAQLAVAEKAAVNNEENLRLAKARFDAGLRPALDVVQGQMSVTQAKATIPPLRQSVAQSINTIALLCGVYPSEVSWLAEPVALPEAPVSGDLGNPESLLRRRPDIVEAEKQLAAKAAAVGVAKKDFLPTLSLSMTVGTESLRLDNLFQQNSLYYTFMPSLTWTLFDGLATKIRIAEAKVAMEESITQYNLTVMTAVNEVNNAILNLKTVGEQLVFDDMLVRDSRHQLQIQMDRYTQGLNGFSDVTGAEITLLQYETNLISTRASQLVALVTLYSALGGGW